MGCLIRVEFECSHESSLPVSSTIVTFCGGVPTERETVRVTLWVNGSLFGDENPDEICWVFRGKINNGEEIWVMEEQLIKKRNGVRKKKRSNSIVNWKCLSFGDRERGCVKESEIFYGFKWNLVIAIKAKQYWKFVTMSFLTLCLDGCLYKWHNSSMWIVTIPWYMRLFI